MKKYWSLIVGIFLCIIGYILAGNPLPSSPGSEIATDIFTFIASQTIFFVGLIIILLGINNISKEKKK